MRRIAARVENRRMGRSGRAFGRRGDDEKVLERFKPTTGMLTGWAGLVVAAFTIGYVALNVHTVGGLRLALGALFAAALIWATQLRPRVSAYTRSLHLKGMVRDAVVPYVLIDEVTMAQTLNVWVGERRFVCIGIGKSLVADVRQRAKSERQGSLLGASRTHEFSDKAEMAAPDQTAMSYQTFVVTRIEELVDHAKREVQRGRATADGAEVTRPYAVPEIAALVVTGLLFLASLAL
jgi:hypothetical protein